MDEQTPVKVVTKTSLPRKALILTGATVGLILAGGFAYLKTQSTTEDEIVVDEPTED